jgi:hypothetical protein
MEINDEMIEVKGEDYDSGAITYRLKSSITYLEQQLFSILVR